MNSKFKFDKIAERDMDFLFMLLFHECPDFLNLFIDDCKNAEIVHIENSLTDAELGESDITVIYEQNGKRYGLLIEDKIDAIAMKNQSGRYQMRGKRNTDFDEFVVYIVAPQHYLYENEEAKKYPNRLSYEEIREFVVNYDIPCKEFAVAMLTNSIEYEKSGYKMIEVLAITEFWNKLYNYICSKNTGVSMYEPTGPKGARSTWIQFGTFLKGTALYYKTNYGYIDLEFKGKASESKELKSLLKDYITTNMNWVQTGKSLSLRIETHCVDVRKPYENYAMIMDEVLGNILVMTNFANKINNTGILD